jgi:hypothetical protein
MPPQISWRFRGNDFQTAIFKPPRQNCIPALQALKRATALPDAAFVN